MDRLIITLVIIFASLAAGYALTCRVVAKVASGSLQHFDAMRIRIQKVAMFGLIPVSAMLSLWGLPAPAPRLLFLPLLGLSAWITGGASAIMLSRFLSLDRRQTGSMFCCGSFTNIGAVGSLICVMQYGEQTIALASLYRLCEEFFYFAVAYPIARWYSLPAESAPRLDFTAFRMEPVLKAVLTALSIGLALNLFGVPRSDVFGTCASASMIAGTICFLLSIGMGLRLSSLANYLRESACLSLIKFLIVPLIIITAASLLGLGSIDDGLPLKVVAILSSMPVAMNALIPPSIFHLDLDLANSCWIITTLALIIVVPVLYAVLPAL